MPKEFDIREEMENQADVLRQNEQSSGIPQWMRENLETQPQERSLPAWVKANLEGNRDDAGEPFERGGRTLESTKTLGGVIRDLFRRGDLEASEVSQERYDVTEATEAWHLQEEPYSCANACQEFIIDEFLDIDVQESDLNSFARDQNWLREKGTGLEDVGNLLELFGIETHRYWDAEFEDIREALNHGDRVIVAVHNAALDESWWDIIPVLSANHAVEVVGIDDTDPKNVKVIINDPGVADGCGKVVTMDTFNQAREGSGGFMVVAERP